MKRGVISSVAECPVHGEDIQFWEGHLATDLSLCSLSLQALQLSYLEDTGCQYWSSGERLLWHFLLAFYFSRVKPVRFRMAWFCVGNESNQSDLDKLLWCSCTKENGFNKFSDWYSFLLSSWHPTGFRVAWCCVLGEEFFSSRYRLLQEAVFRIWHLPHHITLFSNKLLLRGCLLR